MLKQCLESVFANTNGLDFEIIVINNDSGDGTVEMVEENFPQVQLVKSSINLGFARACNLGLKRASGENLLLLNPDTRLVGNSLKIANNILINDHSIGILGGQLLNYDKSIQPSVRSFPKFTDHLMMIFKLHHLIKLKRYLALDFDYQKQSEVDQVMGAFFLISRPAWEKIGDFDDRYYIWFEEVDYCQRAKRAGFKVVYSPEPKIIHYGGRSFKQVFTLKNQWIFSKSRLRYVLKHQGFFSYAIIFVLTPVSLILTLLKFKNVE